MQARLETPCPYQARVAGSEQTELAADALVEVLDPAVVVLVDLAARRVKILAALVYDAVAALGIRDLDRQSTMECYTG